jgi:hypothetical protein
MNLKPAHMKKYFVAIAVLLILSTCSVASVTNEEALNIEKYSASWDVIVSGGQTELFSAGNFRNPK